MPEVNHEMSREFWGGVLRSSVEDDHGRIYFQYASRDMVRWSVDIVGKGENPIPLNHIPEEIRDAFQSERNELADADYDESKLYAMWRKEAGLS